MSRRNDGVFPLLVGGHSDRPAPDALSAIAPTNVSATAPPIAPTVRGLRFPRSQRSWTCRCTRPSARFATGCARQRASRAACRARRSVRCAAGSKGRSVSCSARNASCTNPGREGFLIGRGVPGSGIPENGSLICFRPPQKFWVIWLAEGRSRARIVKVGSVSSAAADSAVNRLIPNHMERRDRNCIFSARPRGGANTGPVGQCARRRLGPDLNA